MWRDDGTGITEGRYRAGFVAGAEWADTRSRETRDRAIAGLARAKADLKAARALPELATRDLNQAARDRLVLRIAEIVDECLIDTWPERQAIVRDPTAVARDVLDVIIASGDTAADAALKALEPNNKMDAGTMMRFQEHLPPGESPRRKAVDWAEIKRMLLTHEGKWGLIAEDVAGSTLTRMRAGKYPRFGRGELAYFEFAGRKPEDPYVPYEPGHIDLWGRYIGNAAYPE